MVEPKDRFHETNTENPDFQAQIDAITDRDLTPDNIATYADDALIDFIAIIDEITSSYDRSPTITQESGADNERSALRYASLDPDYVEITLDHIADTAADIKRVAVIAEQLTGDSTDVITPPDEGAVKITFGNGIFEAKKTIPRLQTTLFILEKTFGIDIDPDTSDEDVFRFVPGAVTNGMMRQTPYDIIDLPKLNRVIDICDEEGNRTFVFDRNKLQERGITVDVLKHMTKDEIKDLIKLHEGIGRDLIYSDLFVENMISLLNSIPETAQKNIEVERSSSKLLKPEIEQCPEEFLSIKSMTTLFRVSYRTIEYAVEKLGDQLGEVIFAKFGSRVGRAFSPAQQEVIKQFIDENGFGKDAPEGYVSATQLGKEFGVKHTTIHRAVREIGDEFGEVLRTRFNSGYGSAYSPAQQEMIRQNLSEKGTLLEAAPEDYLTRKAIAGKLGITHAIVNRVVDEMSEQLGESLPARVGGMATVVYSPYQQEMIRQELVRREILVPQPPDGYLSLKAIADELDVTSRLVTTAIEALGDQFGEVIQAKFKAKISSAFSPAQQDMIRQFLTERGSLVEAAPEGYLSVRGITGKFDVTQHSVERAIRELDDGLGEVIQAKFGPNRRPAYSPSQQEMIVQWIRQNIRVRSLGRKAVE